jgi:ABC-type Fe3+/spermidine/putrescine transport system ATPase subunit
VVQCRTDGSGGFSLRVRGQSWEGECRAGEEYREGEPVIVLVRPENVRLANGTGSAGSADDAGLSWTGQVKQLAFRGARVSLAVETPVQRLNVEAPALMRVQEGDALSLSVPRHGAWAIRPAAEP